MGSKFSCCCQTRPEFVESPETLHVALENGSTNPEPTEIEEVAPETDTTNPEQPVEVEEDMAPLEVEGEMLWEQILTNEATGEEGSPILVLSEVDSPTEGEETSEAISNFNATNAGERTITYFNAANAGELDVLKDLLAQDLSLLDTTDDRKTVWNNQQKKYYPMKGATACIYAADAGNTECLLALILMNADLNVQESSGYTALMRAAKEGKNECLEALLGQEEVDKEATDNDGVTAIMHAARSGNGHCLKGLVDAGGNIDAQENDGWSALICAVSRGNEDCLKMLLKTGANTKLKTNTGATAFFMAIEFARFNCIALLLNAGVDPEFNIGGHSGSTLFKQACEEEQLDCIGALLIAGFSSPDINIKKADSCGLKFLMKAATDGNNAFLKALLEAQEGFLEAQETVSKAASNGNDASLKALLEAQEGILVAQETVSKNHLFRDHSFLVPTWCSLCRNILIGKGQICILCDILIHNQCQISAQKGKDCQHQTVFLAAAKEGDLKRVKILIETRIDINLQDQDGYTAFLWAACKGQIEVCKFLLQHGAKARLRTYDGWSALEAAKNNRRNQLVEFLVEFLEQVMLTAAKNGDISTVRQEIEEGADINACDCDGYTALIWAACMGHFDVCTYLLKTGANVQQKTHDGWTALQAAKNNHMDDIVKLLIQANENQPEAIQEQPTDSQRHPTSSEVLPGVVVQWAAPALFDETKLFGSIMKVSPQKDTFTVVWSNRTKTRNEKQDVWFVSLGIVFCVICESLLHADYFPWKRKCGYCNDDIEARTVVHACSNCAYRIICPHCLPYMKTKIILMEQFKTSKAVMHSPKNNQRCIDFVDHAGETALMKAACAGRISTCEFLINYGASVSMTNSEGKSALLLAKLCANSELACLLVRMDNSISKDEKENELFQLESGLYCSIYVCKKDIFLRFVRLIEFEEALAKGYIIPYPGNGVILFCSHRWLDWKANPPHPDKPDNIKHNAIKKAIEEHADFQDVEFVWIDLTCVPQKDKLKQQLAINSLPQIIALSSHFMILVGESQIFDDHKRDEASLEVYRSRGWCRLEYVSAAMADNVCRWICNINTGMVKRLEGQIDGDDINPFRGNFQDFEDRRKIAPMVFKMYCQHETQIKSDAFKHLRLDAQQRLSTDPKSGCADFKLSELTKLELFLEHIKIARTFN